MSEKRKRSQNFTLDEKDRLIKLLLNYKNTILNKKTDGATNESKAAAWTELTNSFNYTGSIYRSKESLMKIWEKIKSESKIYYTATRRDATQTGGGPSVVKIDPILEQVCSILGRGCTGISGVPDSDDTSVVVTEIDLRPDPDDNPTSKIVVLSEEENHKENVEHPYVIAEPIQKTPLWSRRRPILSQLNERTEAVASLCDSFKDVNKKKEDIENLKQQLLMEELEFKRKLYELQLQSAQKEVEIKNEVLRQIRGGDMKFGNIFNFPQKE